MDAHLDMTRRAVPSTGAPAPGRGRAVPLAPFVLILVALLLLLSGGCGEEEALEANGIGDQLASVQESDQQPTPASFISLCANCHNKLDPGPEDMTADWRLERKLIFDHPAHFAQGIRCQACHQEFPHKPGYTEHVPVETCFTCHGSVHGQQGVMAPTDCEYCHTAEIEPVTPDHEAPDWVLASGETKAKHSQEVQSSANRQLYCKMCHERTYCRDCHRMEMPHPADWMGGHGETASEERPACIMCHETQRMCDDCHHQAFPTMVDWGADHKQVATVQGAQECYSCHEPPDCSSCHVRTSKERESRGG